VSSSRECKQRAVIIAALYSYVENESLGLRSGKTVQKILAKTDALQEFAFGTAGTIAVAARYEPFVLGHERCLAIWAFEEIGHAGSPCETWR
jgi:hypothetical protein